MTNFELYERVADHRELARFLLDQLSEWFRERAGEEGTADGGG